MKLKNFIWYFKTFLFCILHSIGVYRAVARKFDFSRFKDKKILVLGSGPSLALFPKVNLDNFDVVVAINDAGQSIENLRMNERYIFSCDTEKMIGLRLKSRSLVPMLLVPTQTNFPIAMRLLSARSNAFINFPKYRFNLRTFASLDFKLPVYSVNLSTVPGEQYQLNDEIPVYGHTSAFTLLNILLIERVSSVTLLGIDLTNEYSSELKSAPTGEGHNRPDVIERMRAFENHFLTSGIAFSRGLND